MARTLRGGPGAGMHRLAQQLACGTGPVIGCTDSLWQSPQSLGFPAELLLAALLP